MIKSVWLILKFVVLFAHLQKFMVLFVDKHVLIIFCAHYFIMGFFENWLKLICAECCCTCFCLARSSKFTHDLHLACSKNSLFKVSSFMLSLLCSRSLNIGIHINLFWNWYYASRNYIIFIKCSVFSLAIGSHICNHKIIIFFSNCILFHVLLWENIWLLCFSCTLVLIRISSHIAFNWVIPWLMYIWATLNAVRCH